MKNIQKYQKHFCHWWARYWCIGDNQSNFICITQYASHNKTCLLENNNAGAKNVSIDARPKAFLDEKDVFTHKRV